MDTAPEHQSNGKQSTTIQITHRDERSFFMKVIQVIVRQLRNQLNKREPKHEDGSIRLDPNKAKVKLWKLQERTVSDIYIYDFVPLSKPLTAPKRRLYYFAGGSWQTKPTGQHYKLCGTLAKELSATVVSIVSPPLAPNDPASTSFPWCMKLYRKLMEDAREAGEEVILAGDSSGANMIICLTLEALREDSTTEKPNATPLKHPQTLMAICPSTDLTRTNPIIKKIAHRDPLLSPEIIKGTARAWHGDWDPSDRRVSPINNEIGLLARAGISVNGVTAGNDVLSPDGIIFRDRCAEEGVRGEWLHWENQMHCFLLTAPYGLKEAREAMEWVVGVLKKE